MIISGKPRGLGLEFALTLLSLIGGCGSFPASHDSGSTQHAFHEALDRCRTQQPARHVNRRLHLPSTDPGVAACLSKKGWNPDGTPKGG